MNNICSKCSKEVENNRVNQRYCKDCHNEHARRTRKKHKDLNEEQKLKANCRSYLNTYLKRGLIEKQKCNICGASESEAHHEDYSKPLVVIWLCREHHLELH
jgi:hypothetical protein